ncbi:sulfotransferase [Vallicoccus soli]|uniref:Sulfotransferase n=1 Tax=Vallicoccus soli TaxID=2339232 RepID=A0A3A3Z9Z0_9ACTN|nr:sulfotransferase [Vallicoccus soli]RJK97906.1 sulfotransferase [Vallicoccus soli]
MAQHVEVPDRLRTLKRRVPAPAKAAARRALRTAGVATAGRRVPPDFLLVGTKRGGTTSLWNYLVAHPGVLPMFPAAQQIKSPHYFDIHYGRGRDWYLSHFPTAGQRERARRRTGAPVRTGEASPYYVFHPLARERIVRDLPDVRVLVTLRNPVDRAYSHYNERVGGGTEPLRTFEEAIEAEPERLRGEEERIRRSPGYYSHHHDNSSYLARGRYVEHLAPWLRDLPPDRLLVLVAEDLYADPDRTFRQVCAFLGLAGWTPPSFPRHNHLPARGMAPATRARLVEHFRGPNAELARVLGRDLPWDR